MSGLSEAASVYSGSTSTSGTNKAAASSSEVTPSTLDLSGTVADPTNTDGGKQVLVTNSICLSTFLCKKIIVTFFGSTCEMR